MGALTAAPKRRRNPVQSTSISSLWLRRARVSLTLRLICGYLLRSLLPFLTCIYETLLDLELYKIRVLCGQSKTDQLFAHTQTDSTVGLHRRGRHRIYIGGLHRGLDVVEPHPGHLVVAHLGRVHMVRMAAVVGLLHGERGGAGAGGRQSGARGQRGQNSTTGGQEGGRHMSQRASAGIAGHR